MLKERKKIFIFRSNIIDGDLNLKTFFLCGTPQVQSTKKAVHPDHIEGNIEINELSKQVSTVSNTQIKKPYFQAKIKSTVC